MHDYSFLLRFVLRRSPFLCHTYCVILPDFQRKLHPYFVSYILCHTLFYCEFFCHTPAKQPNFLSHIMMVLGSLLKVAAELSLYSLTVSDPPGVPKGPEGAAFFKLKPTLWVSMDFFWPQGRHMMVPNSVWTSNGPRSLKILKAPCTFTFNLLQYGCLRNTFDLRVGARWTLTVSGLPWTPLMSLKVSRALHLFKLKSL